MVSGARTKKIADPKIARNFAIEAPERMRDTDARSHYIIVCQQRES
jgi:hypothetical protein